MQNDEIWKEIRPNHWDEPMWLNWLWSILGLIGVATIGGVIIKAAQLLCGRKGDPL